jgi:hypothetical protein
MDIYMETAKALTDAIERGFDKLQEQRDAKEAEEIKRQEINQKIWSDFELETRYVLPEVLKPYAKLPERINQKNESFHSTHLIIRIPELAPIEVAYELKSSRSSRYSIESYIIPSPFRGLDDNDTVTTYWDWDHYACIKTQDFEVALAIARERGEEAIKMMADFKETRQAATDKPEPVYVPDEADRAPKPDEQMVEALRLMVRSEVNLLLQQSA